ncbi:MAG: hypothetical protein QNJ16_15415 [Rhodobacter sp.]|nr:hypothetical protein [Rhodobacter sp.]
MALDCRIGAFWIGARSYKEQPGLNFCFDAGHHARPGIRGKGPNTPNTIDFADMPPPRSLTGQHLAKRSIDSLGALLPCAQANLVPLTPEDRHGRGRRNFNDITASGRYDRDSTRHQLTDLNDLFFQHRRNCKLHIVILELGGGIGVDQLDTLNETSDDTFEMRLEFSPKAAFSALDRVKNLSGIVDRISELQGDYKGADEITEAVDLEPDIVIVTTRISHHQQNGFLAFFPKLAPDSLCAIDVPRNHSTSLEKQGAVKTAALLQGYVERAVFGHSDEETAEKFNGLRANVSGRFAFPANIINGRRDQRRVVH